MFELTDGDLGDADLAALDAVEEFELREAPDWTYGGVPDDVPLCRERHVAGTRTAPRTTHHTPDGEGAPGLPGPLLASKANSRATEAVRARRNRRYEPWYRRRCTARDRCPRLQPAHPGPALSRRRISDSPRRDHRHGRQAGAALARGHTALRMGALRTHPLCCTRARRPRPPHGHRVPQDRDAVPGVAAGHSRRRARWRCEPNGLAWRRAT